MLTLSSSLLLFVLVTKVRVCCSPGAGTTLPPEAPPSLQAVPAGAEGSLLQVTRRRAFRSPDQYLSYKIKYFVLYLTVIFRSENIAYIIPYAFLSFVIFGIDLEKETVTPIPLSHLKNDFMTRMFSLRNHFEIIVVLHYNQLIEITNLSKRKWNLSCLIS